MLEQSPDTVTSVSKFQDRLKEAMGLSEKSVAELARVLVSQKDGTIGATPQTVYSALNGKTVSFTAENCARAARFLGVDHYWLATGIGKPKGTPRGELDPDQVYVLERMQRMSRNHLDMLMIAVDAFSGTFADRATLSISYGQRSPTPIPAPVQDHETPAD